MRLFFRVALTILRQTALLGALLTVVGVSAVLTMRVLLASQEVVVPSVIGQRVPDAGDRLHRVDLLLRVEGRRHHPTVPQDSIVSQEPEAGTALKVRRSVRVWLSLGPDRVIVPEVEGQSVRSARLALDQAAAPLARVLEIDDLAPQGTVILQHPAAGQSTASGKGVTLVVSRGKAGVDYVMPDVIGKPADRVLTELAAAGLHVSDLRYRSYPGVSPGTVIKQSPAPGYRVDSRSAIILDLSRETP